MHVVRKIVVVVGKLHGGNVAHISSVRDEYSVAVLGNIDCLYRNGMNTMYFRIRVIVKFVELVICKINYYYNCHTCSEWPVAL